MYDRIILHCDLNNFFASVECLSHPELKDSPVAVCGNEKERHGIILAKNEVAKAYGVKTAEPVWEAKLKCPNLVLLPPHYEKYEIYSACARHIYMQYTDMVEPFGIDECWLDVTGSTNLFGSGFEIAEQIRNEMKARLGLTISVGVSFNKIFAKLGSDLKKPDATSVISPENFREVVWPLPASDLLGVGRATYSRLRSVGVFTIGDIVTVGEKTLSLVLGKNGVRLFHYASGLDNSRVLKFDEMPPVKSVGKGTTTPRDITTQKMMKNVLLSLCENVCTSLREINALAGTVQVSIKDKNLRITEHQRRLLQPTRFPLELMRIGMDLINDVWQGEPIRAVSIRASELIGESDGIQLSLDTDNKKFEMHESLELNISKLRKRYGRNIIKRASLMQDIKYTPTFLPPSFPR